MLRACALPIDAFVTRLDALGGHWASNVSESESGGIGSGWLVGWLGEGSREAAPAQGMIDETRHERPASYAAAAAFGFVDT